MLCHHAGHCLPDQEGPFDVDAHHCIKIGFADFQKVGCTQDAGIVDQDINALVLLDGLRHQGIDLGLVAHVAGDENRAQLGGQCLTVALVEVGDHHLGAVAGKAASAGFADSLCAAGDDDHASCMAERNGSGWIGHGVSPACWS